MSNVLTLGGFGTGYVTDVSKYPTVQEALDDAPSNGTLFFPHGSYTAPDANGWLIDKSIEILGEGSDGFGNLTQFLPYGSTVVGGAPNSRVFKVAASTQSVRFRNFLIRPQVAPTSTGTGDGIWFDCSTQQNYHQIADCQIWEMGRDGVRADGGTFNQTSFQRMNCSYNRNNGVYISAGADNTFYDCAFSSNLINGAKLIGSGLVANSILFNGNGTAASGEAQLYLSNHGFELDSVDLEQFEITTTKRGIHLENCRGGAIHNCRTYNPTQIADTVAIYGGSNNRGISVTGGTAANVHYFVQVVSGQGNRGWVAQAPGDHTVSATCPALISLPTDTSATATSSGGNIEFPTMTRTGVADAIGNSFIAGIALPSVNDKANITNPNLKDGWLIYDSSDGFLYIRTGGAWVKVGAQ